MTPLETFAPVAAVSLVQFEGLLLSLPSSQRSDLLSHTLQVIDFSGRGLGFERQVLETALSSGSEEQLLRAASLYERPGRLFYEGARHVREIARRLGREIPDINSAAPLPPEDLAAQRAWHWLGHLEGGAAQFADMGAFYDPVGAFSGGIIHFLDRQGLRAHWRSVHHESDDRGPPPAFGILSREKPGRRERYNQGHVDKIGNVVLDFPPELRMVVVPPVYAELLRGKLEFHLTVPASEILEDWVSSAWAKGLHPNARVQTGIKSLVSGMRPLQYFDKVLREAGRPNVPVTDFLGFLSSSKLMRENREFYEGKRASLEPVEIVLACKRGNVATAQAHRMAGPGARTRVETFEGISLTIVENLDLPRPVRFVIVDDPDVIDANEIASIDKNLQAVRLGGDLFNAMLPYALKGEAGGESLYGQFAQAYDREMRRAEVDIRKVLELEGVPASKRILLPGVLKDLYGSWGTEDFGPLYELVSQIFSPTASPEAWQEAMILLKLKVGQYYSVRNPCYGFCMAANRAAMMHGRWLSRNDVEVSVKRLQEKGLLSEGQVSLVGSFEDKSDVHFFFSMIPEGLLPEGLQIAEQMKDRCKLIGVRVNELPQSYQEAHRSALSLRRSLFFDPGVALDVVKLSRELAHVFPGDSRAEKRAYLGYLERLLEHFEQGYKILRASRHMLPGSGDTQFVLKRLIAHLRRTVRRVHSDEGIGPREISMINQVIVETLTVVSRFYFLNQEEGREEASYLMRRLKKLHTSQTKDFGDLFPEPASPGGTVDGPFARLLVERRDAIFDSVGQGLIELTYEMNVRLHSIDQPITKREIGQALKNIIQALEDTVDRLSRSDQLAAFFLGGLKETIRLIQKGLPKKLDQHRSHLTYQALAEALIHTRRFLVLPEDRAAVEVQYTIKRFQRILEYVRGDRDIPSPLWHFGNGNSRPPPKS
jgi:hypothetical protein